VLLGDVSGAIMPDEMGTFRVDVRIENPARPGQARTLNSVLVDTGAELSWVPAAVLESLGVERNNQWRFRQADGTILERWTETERGPGIRPRVYSALRAMLRYPSSSPASNHGMDPRGLRTARGSRLDGDTGPQDPRTRRWCRGGGVPRGLGCGACGGPRECPRRGYPRRQYLPARGLLPADTIGRLERAAVVKAAAGLHRG